MMNIKYLTFLSLTSDMALIFCTSILKVDKFDTYFFKNENILLHLTFHASNLNEPNPTNYNVGGLLKFHENRKKTNVKFKPIPQLKYYSSKSHALTFKLTITNIIQEVKIRPLTY